MAYLTFLPDELLELILDNISRPQHLISLCLTCSKLRDLAFHRLYGQVIINIQHEDSVESLLSGLYSLNCHCNTTGRRYPIRSLVILDDGTLIDESGKLSCSRLSDEETQFRITRILAIIPPVTLRIFKFASFQALSFLNLQLLIKSQSTIEELSFVASDSYIRMISSEPGLQCLRSFECAVNTHGSYLYGFSAALSRLQQLEHFAICASYDFADQPNDGFMYKALGEVLSLLRFESISSLALEGINLGNSVYLANPPSFQSLRRLAIQNCERPAALLRYLTEAAKSSASFGLKELRYAALIEDYGNGLNELIRLLDAFNGLRSLLLYDTNVSRIPLIKHAQTLKKLALLQRDPDILLIEMEQEALSNIPLLEQCALTCSKSYFYAKHATYRRKALNNLLNGSPRLRTLHLNESSPTGLHDASKEHRKTRQWHNIAESLFHHMQDHDLARDMRVISISSTIGSASFASSDLRILRKCFIKETHMDNKGQQIYAEELPEFERQLKYIESESDILNWKPWNLQKEADGRPSLGH